MRYRRNCACKRRGRRRGPWRGRRRGPWRGPRGVVEVKLLFTLMLLNGIIGCTQAVDVIVEPEDLSVLAEEYCMAHPTLPCGHVYQCETPAENKLGLTEICVPQFIDISVAEVQYGACTPSTDPRFDGGNLCWWCCGEGCTAGCNAYNGCFCN
jgi:hypothetical protein